MKKILTFLMMLLISGSVLMAQEAQMPKFRYQAVLRDANNVLVANQSGTVVFTIGGVEWTEDFTTNENGLVSKELEPNNDVNWAEADEIQAVFTIGSGDNAKTITLTTPIAVVPVALQAGDVTLTTDIMTEYIGRSSAYDVERIAQAFEANPEFTEAFVDSVVNYIMANYPIAKDVAFDYLSKVDSQQVADAYDSARLVNDNVKQAVYDIVKNYLKSHRNLLLDVASYYISSATLQEAQELYAAFEHSAAASQVRQILLDYFATYLSGHGVVCSNSNQTLCSAVNYVVAHTVCPAISSVQGVRYSSDQSQRIVFQVYVDNMGVVDLANVTVQVTFYKGDSNEPVSVTKPMERNGNYFSFELTQDVESVNGNLGFDVTLIKSGCQDDTEHGVYTNPNNQ